MLVPETMSQKFRGAQVALLQNSAGHRLKGSKIRRAKVEGSKTPGGVLDPSTCALQSFGPLNLCPAEFWTPQPVPRGVLEQCKLCPAELWRHSFRDQHNH